MSYKPIAEIPRAARTFWSPERGGRTRQFIGHWVKKFAFSPFTAKSRTNYTFYADVLMEEEIESPPGSGTRIRNATIEVVTGTYLKFRDMIRSGEAWEKLNTIVEVMGGSAVVSATYWRTIEFEYAVAEEV